MNMFYKIFSVLFLVSIVIFNGCNNVYDHHEVLRIGTNIWPGYEFLYLARNLGLFKEKPVKLVELTSSTDVMRAFRNNSLEAAALTLDEALLLAQYESQFYIIIVTDFSHGADVIIAKPEIKTIKELKGKTIGVENTALGAFMLSRALEKSGLKRSDVNIVSLDISEHENSFINDHIDAVVTFEPVSSRIRSKGGGKNF